jgi:hypothetical protein
MNQFAGHHVVAMPATSPPPVHLTSKQAHSLLPGACGMWPYVVMRLAEPRVTMCHAYDHALPLQKVYAPDVDARHAYDEAEPVR